MIELEQQLMEALRTLYAQFKAEQQRHSGEVEALQQLFEQQAAENATFRQRVQRLTGHVTCLDRDYRTLAETLRRSAGLIQQHVRQRRPERDHGPSR